MTLGSPIAAEAQAQAQSFDLQWRAPSGCWSESAARAEIAKLIRTASDETERVQARVQIDGAPQTGYVADIAIERGGSSGERTLRGARCVEVAEAAVLIVAMVIDPEAASRAASTTPPASPPPASSRPEEPQPRPPEQPAPKAETAPPEPAEEPAPSREPEEPEEPEPDELEEGEPEPDEPSDPRARGKLALGIFGGGDAGSLPKLTASGGLVVGLMWPRSRLELRALAFLPQHVTEAPGSGAEIGLFAGALAGCVDLAGGRDEPRALGACAVLEAGLSSGAARGVSDGQNQAGVWLAGFAGIDARHQLAGPLHLRAHAELGLPILRPDYEIAPFGRVFRASPALFRFGISAFVLFP